MAGCSNWPDRLGSGGGGCPCAPGNGLEQRRGKNSGDKGRQAAAECELVARGSAGSGGVCISCITVGGQQGSWHKLHNGRQAPGEFGYAHGSAGIRGIWISRTRSAVQFESVLCNLNGSRLISDQQTTRQGSTVLGGIGVSTLESESAWLQFEWIPADF